MVSNLRDVALRDLRWHHSGDRNKQAVLGTVIGLAVGCAGLARLGQVRQAPGVGGTPGR